MKIPRKKALEALKGFIDTFPLTFQIDLSLALLRGKEQTKTPDGVSHDYLFLARRKGEETFSKRDIIDFQAMIAPLTQKVKDKIKVSFWRLEYKKKLWNGVYVDIMPELKSKFKDLMEKAKETPKKEAKTK